MTGITAIRTVDMPGRFIVATGTGADYLIVIQRKEKRQPTAGRCCMACLAMRGGREMLRGFVMTTGTGDQDLQVVDKTNIQPQGPGDMTGLT